jgi:hypothetical protein
MGRRVVLGDLRVQPLELAGGRRAFTIVWPEGSLHAEADGFLRQFTAGTQRTFAYLLVDHLRWLERECLSLAAASLRDLERYIGIVGAEVRMPLGERWRVGKRPYGPDALSAAACLKGFYLYQAAGGVNRELGRALNQFRLPTQADRGHSLLGHVHRSVPANPLTPKRSRRRHPKMLPDGARNALLPVARTARDRLVITWLADAGFRIGELCGLHLSDLHLVEPGLCADCRAAHVHVCHREGNANPSAGEGEAPWCLEGGLIQGGLGAPRSARVYARIVVGPELKDQLARPR